MFYTGIGSRQTPKEVLDRMAHIGKEFANMGFTLRSGGADGADSAFERGCDMTNGSKEIYIPWEGFNNLSSSTGYKIGNNPDAYDIAANLHPAWNRCSQGARKLHTRNVYQILGTDLNTPSVLVVCWTPNGELSGGTAQAMRLAMQHNIRIVNLATC